MRSRLFASVALALCTASTVCPSQAIAAQQQGYSIPPGDLKDALDAYVRQSSRQLIYRADEVRGVPSPGASGNLTADAALAALLKGTEFVARTDASGAIAIVSAVGNGPSATGAATDHPNVERTGNRPADENAIVVTGTYLPTANGGASPVQSYSREEVERRGYSTVGQFLQTLPQNSGGGANENSSGSRASPDGNFAVGGTGANLRGLGTLSTLTLINGLRMAPTGRRELVDISAIPASVIKRIEILTDGASATYGSDAVAGVVNIILRDDFDGLETRLRHVDGNSFHENEIALTAGKAWNSGQLMATYDFRKHSGLDANDRSFTRDAPDPLQLIAKTETHSAFVIGRQELSPSFRLRGQGFYNKRHFERSINFGIPIFNNDKGSVEQYLASVSGELDLPGSWSGEITGLTSWSKTKNNSFPSNGGPPLVVIAVSRSYELQALAKGPLIHLPAGNALLAIGGQYERATFREESFDPDDAKRNRWSAYFELLVPIVSAEQNVTGITELTLSAAGRHDHYSDFGSSNNPKLGIVWRPVENLKLRASYGTAFRVPTFDDLNDALNSNFAFRIPDPTSPTGTTGTIFLNGANSALQPETAKTFSAGFDLRLGRPFTLSVTYWNINYKNRIIIPTNQITTVLRDEHLFGDLIIRNPPLSLVQQIASDPRFSNFQNIPLNQIGAIVDLRRNNIATDRLRGFDFQLSGNWDVGRVNVYTTLTGQYIDSYNRKIVPTAPSGQIVDTVFNPTNLKLRFDTGFRIGGLALGGAVNYADDYHDTRFKPSRPIDAWTTVDVNASYRTSDRAPAWLRGLVLSANVVNLFDKDPPFIDHAVAALPQIHYDGANANALGRFVTLQVTKKW